MSLSAYANRRDGNEREIIQAFKGCGLSVYQLDQPLDLLVGWKAVTWLVEVKMPRNKRGEPEPYTKAQNKFIAGWRAHHALAVCVDDALKISKEIKEQARILLASEANCATNKNGSNGASKHPNEPDQISPKLEGGNNG